MKAMITDRKKGWLIMGLGLDAFAGLGLEVLLAFWLEPMLYGVPMEQWNTWQSVLHWIITCLLWGLAAAYLLRTADKNTAEAVKPGIRRQYPPFGKAVAMGTGGSRRRL